MSALRASFNIAPVRVAAGCAEAIERHRRVVHAGIVQQDYIGPHAVLAFAMVRRRPHFGDQAGLRWKCALQHDPEIRSRNVPHKPLFAGQANPSVGKSGVVHRQQLPRPEMGRSVTKVDPGTPILPFGGHRPQPTGKRALTLTFQLFLKFSDR